MPLFQKRAIKFNALLASGVSQELNKYKLLFFIDYYKKKFSLVKEMFDGINKILINVNKYLSIGCENNVVLLQSYLAESVFLLIDRFIFILKISLILLLLLLKLI